MTFNISDLDRRSILKTIVFSYFKFLLLICFPIILIEFMNFYFIEEYSLDKDLLFSAPLYVMPIGSWFFWGMYGDIVDRSISISDGAITFNSRKKIKRYNAHNFSHLLIVRENRFLTFGEPRFKSHSYVVLAPKWWRQLLLSRQRIVKVASARECEEVAFEISKQTKIPVCKARWWGGYKEIQRSLEGH